jgi:dihydropteroate synthase
MEHTPAGSGRASASLACDTPPADLNLRDAAAALDASLSQRFIALDPAGYFLIRVDHERKELVAEHYSNSIDARGLATDPDTGEVLSCRNAGPRAPRAVFRGRTAKQLGILLTEGEPPHPLSALDHALYLGRELQKAEDCLLSGVAYEQD